jgi:hypothetical protein
MQFNRHFKGQSAITMTFDRRKGNAFHELSEFEDLFEFVTLTHWVSRPDLAVGDTSVMMVARKH